MSRISRADRDRRGARRAARPRARSRRSASQGPAARATARRRPSARTASSSMPRRSCIPSSARRVRKALGKGAALMPSSKKRGGPGVALDVPLGHKDAAFVRSHFDGMEVRIADAPRANEIVVAVAVTDSRPPAAARRRPDQGRDQGRGRAALDPRAPRRRTTSSLQPGTTNMRMFPAIVSSARSSPSAFAARRPRRADDTIKIGEINSYSAHARLHRALSQGLAARARRDQRGRRRRRQEARGDHARTTAASRPMR